MSVWIHMRLFWYLLVPQVTMDYIVYCNNGLVQFLYHVQTFKCIKFHLKLYLHVNKDVFKNVPQSVSFAIYLGTTTVLRLLYKPSVDITGVLMMPVSSANFQTARR